MDLVNAQMTKVEDMIKFMKQNDVIKMEIKDESVLIELTKEGIARYHHEQFQKGIKEVERSDRMVKKKEKDEYKEFIMGKDKLERAEIGELYGL